MRAVYGRLLIVRTAEQLGLGMLLASGVALCLVPLAIWQRIATGPILLSCGVLGLLIGGVLALFRKPTRLSAAIEADRQLHFNDLLTSAVWPAAGGDVAFYQTVRNLADARCAAHTPSEVLLRRFGVRGWSAIGLAMSVTITLAIIPLGPSPSQAIDANASVLAAATADHSAPATRFDRGLVRPANDPMSEGASNQQMSISAVEKTTSGNPANVPGTRALGGTTGVGGGSASSPSESERSHQPGTARGRASDSNGITADGGTASARLGGHGESASGNAGSPADGSNQAPGWNGEPGAGTGRSGVSTAEQIPTEDRDLVRDFFQR